MQRKSFEKKNHTKIIKRQMYAVATAMASWGGGGGGNFCYNFQIELFEM